MASPNGEPDCSGKGRRGGVRLSGAGPVSGRGLGNLRGSFASGIPVAYGVLQPSRADPCGSESPSGGSSGARSGERCDA